MDVTSLRSRLLFAVGLLGLAVGTVDPLEGAPLILAAVTALMLAAHLRRSTTRTLFGWALALTGIGVAALYALSARGGFGGRSGRSMWWGALLAPYALGWLLAVIASVREVIIQVRIHRGRRR